MGVPRSTTLLWGELEQGAFGEVRFFLQCVHDDPLNKARLTRLAEAAHAAIYRVERAHRLPEIDPLSMEHP
jgi:hypothetical protein